MEAALAQAATAAAQGEVPVGAVVVHDGELVATAYNERETSRDPTAHAEILALRRAAEALGRWRLSGCTLYVTLEPCPMCAGATVHARIDRLVFGARDPKAGAVRSAFSIPNDPRLNHHPQIFEGVAEAACREVLRAFFRARRGK